MINTVIQILVAMFIGIVNLWLIVVISATIYEAIMEANRRR